MHLRLMGDRAGKIGGGRGGMNNGKKIKEFYIQVPKKDVDIDTILSVSDDFKLLDNVSDDIRVLNEALVELDDDHANRVVADLISKLLNSHVKLSNQILERIESTFYDVTKIKNERAE